VTCDAGAIAIHVFDPARATESADRPLVTSPQAAHRAVTWRKRALLLAALSVLVVAAVVSAAVLDADSGQDTAALVASTGKLLIGLHEPYLAFVVVLAGAHYLAAAVAARAAAGVPLPFGETVLVQLSASAANRITPAGLGGSALIARYLGRRGAMPTSAAVGAVAALTLLGGIADLLVLTFLVAFGSWVGLSGGTAEFGRLVRHISALLGPLRSPWLWAVLAVIMASGLALWLSTQRERLRSWAAGFVAPARVLAQRPRSLLTLLVASGSTTLILAFAFAATTSMVPGHRPSASLGALIIAFMLGSAAGNAVPMPAGLGATEAALAAVLITARVPPAQAVDEVLIFRTITFWMPAALGLLITGHLHRRHAL
jgi:uncharacterized membrane protein YbhN (UPF0104 family)